MQLFALMSEIPRLGGTKFPTISGVISLIAQTSKSISASLSMQPLEWKINCWLMLENIFLVYGDHLVWFSKARVHGVLTRRIHLCFRLSVCFTLGSCSQSGQRATKCFNI